jgi:hypothetical protein
MLQKDAQKLRSPFSVPTPNDPPDWALSHGLYTLNPNPQTLPSKSRKLNLKPLNPKTLTLTSEN